MAGVKWGRAEAGLGLEEGSHVWREGRSFPIGGRMLGRLCPERQGLPGWSVEWLGLGEGDDSGRWVAASCEGLSA